MSLFKKVEEVKSGVKVLGYGKTGTGKTLFALSFPEGCAIDAEDGMAFYKGKYPNLKYILNSTSADEVEEALEEITDEDMIDEIGTFIIDSETKIYENLQHSALNVAERRAKNKGQQVDDANISQREWGKIKLINKRIQSTKIMLCSKGVNIVSIAQEKDIKEKRGENWVTVGYAPDTAKGFEYDYDIVLRLFTEKDSKTGEEIYKAEVQKDRTQTYKKGTIISNPSYNNWKEAIEGKANLKESVINFKQDIGKDEDKMKTELEEVGDLIEQFKDVMKKVKKENKLDIAKKSKELNIDNPLKCTDKESLNKLISYIKTLI
ncbi:AAA family ATPase [Clostridium botulinum]|uniref:AAA family ATPase n=1 Tax=Clostridium botulinum TaxID=1491 RepID=UPI001E354A84|nr:AAA family ATPase [Clostridium botulinum]MCD3275577.1 AAA family ATPase [Clostridium botulinum C/D]MCD3286501.1 AAA family ATPase [Clostridium botulinum C/D]MCD3291470.1 AAA family ATPase [Clostridium botulinum C/D]MCD3303820.1 AAA family ATPase [Clostridium botulinum C/D]